MRDLEAQLPENLALPAMIARRAKREAMRLAREAKRQRCEPQKAANRDLMYLIVCGPFAKIGHSIDVGKRLATLQAGSPYPLELILTRAGGRQAERLMHMRFAGYRISGEWFRLEGSLLAFVDTERAANATCKTATGSVKRFPANQPQQAE